MHRRCSFESPAAGELAGRFLFQLLPLRYILACIFLAVRCPQPSRQDMLVIYPTKLLYEVNETLSFHCGRNSRSTVNSKTTCSAKGTWIPPPTCVSTTTCPGFVCILPHLQSGIALVQLHEWGCFVTGGLGLIEGLR